MGQYASSTLDQSQLELQKDSKQSKLARLSDLISQRNQKSKFQFSGSKKVDFNGRRELKRVGVNAGNKSRRNEKHFQPIKSADIGAKSNSLLQKKRQAAGSDDVRNKLKLRVKKEKLKRKGKAKLKQKVETEST